MTSIPLFFLSLPSKIDVIVPLLAQWERSTAHTARKNRAQSRRRWKLLGTSHIYLGGYGNFPCASPARVGDDSQDTEPAPV